MARAGKAFAQKKNASAKRHPPATALPHRPYSESIGALAMRDLPQNIAERNHYNYVDVELRGKAFDDLPPYEHAALKHHSAMLLYGMRQWHQLSELHVETARLLDGLENCFEHPFWMSVFRHAHNGNDKGEADAFLAKCLNAQDGIASFNWMTVPEHIRVEWTLYNWRGLTGVAPQLADTSTLEQWFPSKTFKRMAILGLADMARTAGDLQAVGHYLSLVDATEPKLRDLTPSTNLADAFLVVALIEYGLRAQKGPDDACQFLTKSWSKLRKLTLAKSSPVSHLHRMKQVYDQRLAHAQAAQSEAMEQAAHKDWQNLLEQALGRIQSGSSS